MERKKWVTLGEFGLSPSADRAPSSPVITLLFVQLRLQLQEEADTHTSMLSAMATLNSSGSFAGAVYQEQVLRESQFTLEGL